MNSTVSQDRVTQDRVTQDRVTQDRVSLSQGLLELGSLLNRGQKESPKALAGTMGDASRRIWQACSRVAQHQGMTLSRRPKEANFDLVGLCEINHLRHRRVALENGWWRQDAGPLLARRATGTVVALILDRQGKNYYLYEGEESQGVRVDKTVAQEILDHGWVLYRPLPLRPLTFFDLVRAGLRGQRRDFFTLAAASVGSAAVALAVPLVIAGLVDQAIVPADHGNLMGLVAALVVAALAASVFQIVHGLTLLRLKSRLDGDLQAALWDRLLSLPVSFYRRFSVGDLGSRAMGLQRIRNLLTGDITSALLSIITAAASWAMLAYYSPPMAFVATALALVPALVTLGVSVLQLRHQRQLQKVRGKVASLMYALLGGIEKLRVGQAESRAFTTWARRFAEQRRHAIAAQRLANSQTVFTSVYGVVGTLTVFALALRAREAGMSVGEFLAFHAAFGQFQTAVFGVVSVVPMVLDFVPTYERIQPILQTLPEAEDDGLDPGELKGAFELQEVSFQYSDRGPKVLDRVSIRIEPGEMVALVGPSGSGKSTCLRLLLGFESPQSGVIKVDGADLRTLDPRLMRRHLGVVLQNHQPMVGDFFRNIIGSRSLSMENAWEAARKVGLAEEIERLPMGMFTFVNQRGASLSGGQRQRLLLARAIVHEPSALLLDEATSALDNQTQDAVIRSLRDLRVTRLVMAHRLSTVRHADRIYVLDSGRVVEQGSFDQLMTQDGLFARMAARQQI